MKALYVYDHFPQTYQTYLIGLYHNIKEEMSVKSLVFHQHPEADFFSKSYGIKDRLQRLLFKTGVSKYPSSYMKTMLNFDIIHIQHSYLWRKLLPLKAFKNRPKIVITLRGGDTYIKPWIDASWVDFYANSDFVDAFVVMSQHQKDYLKKWGVEEHKIHVIPISFGLYSKAQPKYPNPDRLKLVSAFRMTWEKNIEGSIQLAKTLKNKGVDFEYDIYGDGSDLGQLYYLIERYKLEKYVFPKGKIDNQNLISRFSNYDFLVQLSISEAFPTTVLEAQSQGVLCVVSNSGGLPEALNKGTLGVLSEYNNYDYFVSELVKLWKDKNKYYNLSKEVIEFVNNHFSTENEVKKLTQLYHKVNK